MADQPGMQRFMARTAAGNQPDLAPLQLGAPHELALLAQRQYIGVGGDQAGEALAQDGIDAIDQLLHRRSSLSQR